MSRGLFIAVEGGEGAGKSTQIARLADRLAGAGVDVVRSREPGGTPQAEAIRQLLVVGVPERWSVLTETLLVMAARADHVEQVIEPALAAGRWVLCDRFVASTIVYQGVARGLGADRVRALHEQVFGPYYPDLTLVLDLPVAESLARVQTRDGQSKGRFEHFDGDFHEAIRQGFLSLAAGGRQPMTIIEAGRPADAVSRTIWQAVSPYLPERR